MKAKILIFILVITFCSCVTNPALRKTGPQGKNWVTYNQGYFFTGQSQSNQYNNSIHFTNEQLEGSFNISKDSMPLKKYGKIQRCDSIFNSQKVKK